MNRIYDVKQAAHILGISTNTMYKYLNEGKVQGVRGYQRGVFRIPSKSLEKFLGSRLPDDDSKISSNNTPKLTPISKESNEPVIVQVTPPTIVIKITRILLIIALILVIVDIIMNPNFSLSNQAIRLSFIALLTLLAYQFGGFIKI